MSKITIDRSLLENTLKAMDRYQIKRQDFDRFANEITALRDALEQPQQGPVGTLKDTVLGCFGAAFAEGLQEALEETQDAHLRDLVERRLMYALYAAQDTSSTPTKRSQNEYSH